MPYFTGGLRSELLVKRCGDCGTTQAYPQNLCGNCLSKNNVWIRASGKGTIYSFSVVHQTPGPAFRLDVPFTLAFVELEEGVRIMSNIIDVDPRSVYIGMPVQVTWDRRDDVAIPMFKPATPRE